MQKMIFPHVKITTQSISVFVYCLKTQFCLFSRIFLKMLFDIFLLLYDVKSSLCSLNSVSLYFLHDRPVRAVSLSEILQEPIPSILSVLASLNMTDVALQSLSCSSNNLLNFHVKFPHYVGDSKIVLPLKTSIFCFVLQIFQTQVVKFEHTGFKISPFLLSSLIKYCYPKLMNGKNVIAYHPQLRIH